jgi:hypothetical protein
MARRILRPMRPNPLMATRTDILISRSPFAAGPKYAATALLI